MILAMSDPVSRNEALGSFTKILEEKAKIKETELESKKEDVKVKELEVGKEVKMRELEVGKEVKMKELEMGKEVKVKELELKVRLEKEKIRRKRSFPSTFGVSARDISGQLFVKMKKNDQVRENVSLSALFVPAPPIDKSNTLIKTSYGNEKEFGDDVVKYLRNCYPGIEFVCNTPLDEVDGRQVRPDIYFRNIYVVLELKSMYEKITRHVAQLARYLQAVMVHHPHLKWVYGAIWSPSEILFARYEWSGMMQITHKVDFYTNSVSYILLDTVVHL